MKLTKGTKVMVMHGEKWEYAEVICDNNEHGFLATIGLPGQPPTQRLYTDENVTWKLCDD